MPSRMIDRDISMAKLNTNTSDGMSALDGIVKSIECKW